MWSGARVEVLVFSKRPRGRGWRQEGEVDGTLSLGRETIWGKKEFVTVDGGKYVTLKGERLTFR